MFLHLRHLLIWPHEMIGYVFRSYITLRVGQLTIFYCKTQESRTGKFNTLSRIALPLRNISVAILRKLTHLIDSILSIGLRKAFPTRNTLGRAPEMARVGKLVRRISYSYSFSERGLYTSCKKKETATFSKESSATSCVG